MSIFTSMFFPKFTPVWQNSEWSLKKAISLILQAFIEAIFYLPQRFSTVFSSLVIMSRLSLNKS